MASRSLDGRRFRLEVVGGPDRGLSRDFDGGSVQIGAAEGVDLRLTDRTVSRFHMTVEALAGRFKVSDSGSSNGTYLGPYRVVAAFVDDETIITVGDTDLRFTPLAGTTTQTFRERDRMGPMVGRAMPMLRLYDLIERAAASDIPVLIEGETGTGKELVAHLLHTHSKRSEGPFEVLDCASVPEHLVQSELFGHEKGAFTGAVRDHRGVFERTQGGTVFLDELGELSKDLQPVLLRVLESDRYRPVGAQRDRELDVRIVCATHRSLHELINKGEFRLDLYHRLAGCRLKLPSLRERPGDIPLLVDHFISVLGNEDARHTVDPEALTRRLVNRPWPGNIRQLRNAVSRALAGIGEHDDDIIVDVELATNGTLRATREAAERRYLESLMRTYGNDMHSAADVAGMHAKSLARLLRKYDIPRPGGG